MAQPEPYERQTDFSLSLGNAHGTALDEEFDEVKRVTDELCSNLGLIQRDDGQLRNSTVHPDTLTTATLLLIASDWTPKGPWAASTVYAVGDVVEEAGASYVAVVDHMSGTFALDRAAGYWVFLNSTADNSGYMDDAGGTANALVADVALPALSDGLRLRVRAAAANTNATVTLTTVAGTLNIKRLGGQSLLVGDIVGAGHVLDLVYRASNTTWELLNPGRIDAALGSTATGAGASLVAIEDDDEWFTATDVEGALAELAFDLDALSTGLAGHIADTTGAHAATAISFASGAGLSGTDVAAALDELANEKANDSAVVKLAVEDQAFSGGVVVTSKSLGTITTGTVTPDPGDRPLQHYTNNGAHTLAPSSNAGSLLLDITNGASAGSITTSGFTKVVGDSFTTTNGHKFRCHISIGNGGSLLSVQALQ